MYTKWFASKRKKPSYMPPALPHTHVPRVQQQQNTGSDWDKARKLNITIMEYNHRCSIIAKELSFLKVSTGDTVYPSNFDDYKEHGKLLVRAVCRHYDDYGDLAWNEKTPFVLQVSPLDQPNITINCTVSWVSKDMPIESHLHQDC